MKRVASAILPMIAVNRKAPKALHRQIYDAIARQLSVAAPGQGNEFRRPECLPPKCAFRAFPLSISRAAWAQEPSWPFPSGPTDLERAGRQSPRANPFWTSAGRESLFDPCPC